MDKKTMREQGFFIIPTDDWDRYLREVFVKNEMVWIYGNRDQAHEKLEHERYKYQVKEWDLDSNED